MSGSFPVFDAAIAHLVERLQPASVLDIGAGAGKYGRLLARVAPRTRREAIEIDPMQVETHGLQALYDVVHVDDATAWSARHPQVRHDLVLLGDCLHQMSKSAGLDLLNAWVHRAAWIVIVAPEFVVPEPAPVRPDARQAPLVTQRSVWSERDLHWHDLWAWDNVRATTLMVLRGYLPSPRLTLAQWVGELQSTTVMAHHFDGVQTVRPVRPRLEQVPREVEYRLA